MGRVPDYLNRALAGYAAGADFLAEADPRFGEFFGNFNRRFRLDFDVIF